MTTLTNAQRKALQRAFDPTKPPPAMNMPAPVIINAPPALPPRGQKLKPPPRPFKSQKVIQKQKKLSNDAVSRMIKSVMGALNEPVTLLLIAAAAIIVISYTNSPTDNFITKVAEKIGTNTTIGKFMKENASKVVGMVILFPSTFSAPPELNIWLTFMSFALVWIVNNKSYIEYFLMALGLRIFFKVKDIEIRMVVIAVVVGYYYLSEGR